MLMNSKKKNTSKNFSETNKSAPSIYNWDFYLHFLLCDFRRSGSIHKHITEVCISSFFIWPILTSQLKTSHYLDSKNISLSQFIISFIFMKQIFVTGICICSEVVICLWMNTLIKWLNSHVLKTSENI